MTRDYPKRDRGTPTVLEFLNTEAKLLQGKLPIELIFKLFLKRAKLQKKFQKKISSSPKYKMIISR